MISSPGGAGLHPEKLGLFFFVQFRDDFLEAISLLDLVNTSYLAILKCQNMTESIGRPGRPAQLRTASGS